MWCFILPLPVRKLLRFLITAYAGVTDTGVHRHHWKCKTFTQQECVKDDRRKLRRIEDKTSFRLAAGPALCLSSFGAFRTDAVSFRWNIISWRLPRQEMKLYYSVGRKAQELHLQMSKIPQYIEAFGRNIRPRYCSCRH